MWPSHFRAAGDVPRDRCRWMPRRRYTPMKCVQADVDQNKDTFDLQARITTYFLLVRRRLKHDWPSKIWNSRNPMRSWEAIISPLQSASLLCLNFCERDWPGGNLLLALKFQVDIFKIVIPIKAPDDVQFDARRDRADPLPVCPRKSCSRDRVRIRRFRPCVWSSVQPSR